MNNIHISIAKDFSVYPGGRDDSDGPHNGTRFRTIHIIPHLDAKKNITINFDGTRGYGSSFLEEAFGGLIRLGYSKETIDKQIKLVSDTRPSIIEEVNQYIDDAVKRIKASNG